MNGEDRPYVMAFSHMMGVGPLAFIKLVEQFGSARSAYEARDGLLLPILGRSLTNSLIQFRNKFNIQEKYSELTYKKIRIITQKDSEFPPQLLHIDTVPICIYVKGDVANFNFAQDLLFAVVGTRDPSAYGIDVTGRITGDLTRAGMVIVSGMAEGIDAAAHEACLAEGGRTIAVLGCGVDVIYPIKNTHLYHRIIKNGGLVISEFPPGMTVQKGLFIARNRLVTGLSSGTLIVEGSDRSGALISARFAAGQGKDVFAVPGLLTSDVARAPHIMIREGATMITCAQDILDEYRLQPVSSESMMIMPDLPPAERELYKLLLREPKHIDDMVGETGLPISHVLTVLSFLEIKGLVAKNAGSCYSALSPT